MNKPNKTAGALAASVAAVVILAACLCITTLALIDSMVNADRNLYQTGSVKINLNDQKPVAAEHAFLFQPGMMVEKEFFIENLSTWDVYYRLYFHELSGGLADVLDVSIRDGAMVLFSGKASSLTRKNAGAAVHMLRPNERRALTIRFFFPKDAGNNAQNLHLNFALQADAVQTKNNPNRLFH